MNYSLRVAVLAVGTVVVITLPSCGRFFKPCDNCPPVQPPPHFVYTANAAGNPSTVSALSADATTGVLTAVAGSPYNTGSGSVAISRLVVSQRIYVANHLSGDISAFNVNVSSGALSTVAGSPFAVESGVDSMAIEADGQFLYAVSANSANLWIFSIDASGTLTALSGTPSRLLPG